MSAENPYAPPSAEVGDVTSFDVSPALWNPVAAARWSLLFSPIFGSLLHMSNWNALGDPVRAAKSKNWAIGCCGFLFLSLLLLVSMPDSKIVDLLSRVSGLALLLAWYYSLGKQQTVAVAARFGKSYPRRGWAKPLLLALGAFIGFMVAAFVVGIVAAAIRGVGAA